MARSRSSSSSRRSSITWQGGDGGGIEEGAEIGSIIISSMILYLLIQMENEKCLEVCKAVDWRHNYIKYASILTIVLNILNFFNGKLLNSNGNKIMTLVGVINIVNLYALYTYMRDIVANKDCTCANSNHSTVTTIIYYYTKLIVFGPIILILLALLFLLYSRYS
jgi:hypothetical protein